MVEESEGSEKLCVLDSGAVAALRPALLGAGDKPEAPADIWQPAPSRGAAEQQHRQTQPALQRPVASARQVRSMVMLPLKSGYLYRP